MDRLMRFLKAWATYYARLRGGKPDQLPAGRIRSAWLAFGTAIDDGNRGIS